ncbi:MAG: hypothetical protein RL407_605 [Bacteroidota bacterium]
MGERNHIHILKKIKTKKPDYSGFFPQRGRDSNPRYPFGVYTLSRRAPSTTRTPLCLFG